MERVPEPETTCCPPCPVRAGAGLVRLEVAVDHLVAHHHQAPLGDLLQAVHPGLGVVESVGPSAVDTRTARALVRAGVGDVASLLACSPLTLSAMEGIGPVCVRAAVAAALRSTTPSLAPEPQAPPDALSTWPSCLQEPGHRQRHHHLLVADSPQRRREIGIHLVAHHRHQVLSQTVPIWGQDQPLESLEVEPLTLRALGRARITSVAQVLAATPADLSDVRGVSAARISALLGILLQGANAQTQPQARTQTQARSSARARGAPAAPNEAARRLEVARRRTFNPAPATVAQLCAALDATPERVVAIEADLLAQARAMLDPGLPSGAALGAALSIAAPLARTQEVLGRLPELGVHVEGMGVALHVALTRAGAPIRVGPAWTCAPGHREVTAATLAAVQAVPGCAIALADLGEHLGVSAEHAEAWARRCGLQVRRAKVWAAAPDPAGRCLKVLAARGPASSADIAATLGAAATARTVHAALVGDARAVRTTAGRWALATAGPGRAASSGPPRR